MYKYFLSSLLLLVSSCTLEGTQKIQTPDSHLLYQSYSSLRGELFQIQEKSSISCRELKSFGRDTLVTLHNNYISLNSNFNSRNPWRVLDYGDNCKVEYRGGNPMTPYTLGFNVNIREEELESQIENLITIIDSRLVEIKKEIDSVK